jgi:hypothetical protein
MSWESFEESARERRNRSIKVYIVIDDDMMMMIMMMMNFSGSVSVKKNAAVNLIIENFCWVS